MKTNKDVIRQARQTDLAGYLEQRHGYTFKRQGNRLQCIEHDSLVITYGNAYYWNSRNCKGNSIDFLMNHLNMDFKTALEELTNTKIEDKKYSPQLPTEKSNYIITDKYINRAFAYLTKQRKLDATIITNMIDKNHIKMITGDKYKYPTIAFPIFDEDKQIVGYELQGTLDKVKFKGISPDTKYGYGFNILVGKSPKVAYFFESPIDLLSFYQLWKQNDLNVDLSDSLLVSMAGLKANTLTNTLSAFKVESEPLICIDNDIAASNFKKALTEKKISFKSIEIHNQKCKDWNEYLKYKVERA